MTKRNEDGKSHPLRWTPGKWEAGKNPAMATILDGCEGKPIYVGDWQIGWANIEDKNGNVDIEGAIHNASIMSAAPELYAILQEILDNAVINYVYREKAEKIMAKARGEEVE